MAADFAAKKGFTKTSAAITGTSQKTQKGYMATKKLAKKYFDYTYFETLQLLEE